MLRHANRPSLIFILAGLAMIGPFSIDTYLPAFPEIGAELGADREAVQETLSLYMLTFGLMTLWHGALSDSFGRKRVVLFGLFAYALASVGCAFSTSIEMLWTMRAAQGVFAGAGMVVSRAIVRDLYEGPSAQRVMANIAVMFAIAPAIAPIIGGWVLYFSNWRNIFFFIAALAAILFVACWRYLPESLPPEKRQPFAVVPLFRNYRKVFSSASFVQLSFCISACFGGYFLYVLSAPVFIREHLGLGETEFYWLFVPGMFGMMSGSWISGRIAGRWSDQRTLKLAFALMGVAALGNCLISEFWQDSIWLTISPFFVYNIGVAVAMPNVTLCALDLFPNNRGMAASCQSCIQTVSGVFVSSFLAPFLWHSRVGLALGMLGLCALGGCLVWVWFCVSRKRD
ncbi:MAG: multidrug effflux MFS transporter [Zoogloeaceae bacterium]|jgi:DHA1 family bicyclomycin/chloramphenicol resistance-like MFS transporter|nr:multidrug effflux MFS transporter [Zoogloeaceae bacterium]